MSETSNNKPYFQEMLDEMLHAQITLRDKQLDIPLLILIYCTIDIMGWLDCPATQLDSTRKDFKDWVEKYLLPNPHLPVTSEELYSARCAVVHTYSTDSSLVRDKGVSPIVYTAGARPSEEFKQNVDLATLPPGAVSIHVPDLLNEVVIAYGKFLNDVKADPNRLQIANDRAEKMLVKIPGEWFKQ